MSEIAIKARKRNRENVSLSKVESLVYGETFLMVNFACGHTLSYRDQIRSAVQLAEWLSIHEGCSLKCIQCSAIKNEVRSYLAGIVGTGSALPFAWPQLSKTQEA